MQVDLFLLHKGSFRAQELPLRLFLGLETFLLADRFDPNYLLQRVKPVFTTLSRKLHPLSHGGLHSCLKKPRTVEPSGSKEATRRKIFRLTYNKAVDDLDYSQAQQRRR